MKLKIEIEMDNAAFEVGNGIEAGRILSNLANKIFHETYLDKHSSGVLMDFNGNRVGQWKVVGK